MIVDDKTLTQSTSQAAGLVGEKHRYFLPTTIRGNLGLLQVLTDLPDIVEMLQLGFGPADCERLTGISSDKASILLRELGIDKPKTGTAPRTLSEVFNDIGNHLWLGLFVDALEHEIGRVGSRTVTTKMFLHAYRCADTMAQCTASIPGQRYLVLAASWVAKEYMYFSTCPTCETRYVRTKQPLTIPAGAGAKEGGICPCCRLQKQLRAQMKSTASTSASSQTVAQSNFDALLS